MHFTINSLYIMIRKGIREWGHEVWKNYHLIKSFQYFGGSYTFQSIYQILQVMQMPIDFSVIISKLSILASFIMPLRLFCPIWSKIWKYDYNNGACLSEKILINNYVKSHLLPLNGGSLSFPHKCNNHKQYGDWIFGYLHIQVQQYNGYRCIVLLSCGGVLVFIFYLLTKKWLAYWVGHIISDATKLTYRFFQCMIFFLIMIMIPIKVKLPRNFRIEVELGF